MISKYIVFATAFLLTFSAVPVAFAADGVELTPAQYLAANPGLEGPTVSRVNLAPSCMDSLPCMEYALIGGGAQAVEMVFDIAVYNVLTTTSPPTGCYPHCWGDDILSMSYFGIAFNYAKFPGDDVNFRRGMQFLQDYAFIQTVILNSAEGIVADNLALCPPIPSAFCPLTDPVASKYSYSLVSAGEEFEQAGHYDQGGSPLPVSDWLYCDNSGVSCGSSFSSTSEWCIGALGTGAGCGAGTPFMPTLVYGSDHHRQIWAPKIITDLNSIGVQVNAHESKPGNAEKVCLTPNRLEVPPSGQGHYSNIGAIAGYNSPITYDPAQVAPDTCDMYVFGLGSSTPSPIALADMVNSQFAGTTTNMGNYQDLPTDANTADPLVPSCPQSGPDTFTDNAQYEANAVIYAPTVAAAAASFQLLEGAVACHLPVVMGYYERGLPVINTNGWTGFASVDVDGPVEPVGSYYTLQYVHQCGTVSCGTAGQITGPTDATLGGTFNFNMEYGMDGGFGSNPTYPYTGNTGSGPTNLAWQAKIYEELYDLPLVVGPASTSQINAFTDYMVSSYNAVAFNGITAAGPAWYYFQQPCLPGPTCPGRAGPEQAPGLKQHGVGVPLAQKTIVNGEEITYILKPGIYFYDGQQVTNLDWITSLDIMNVAAGPNLEVNVSPFTGISGGPNGLLAAQRFNVGGKPLGVHLFYGEANAWNIANSIPVMMPAHILKYYNPDTFSTVACTADLSMPYASSLASCALLPNGLNLPLNSYIRILPNMNFGSGPFIMSCIGVTHDPATSCYDTTDGAGALDANPYYFNANWQADAAMNVASGTTYTYTTPHMYEIYNPSAAGTIANGPNPGDCGPLSTPLNIGPGTWGLCQLMKPHAGIGIGKVKVYDSGGIQVRNLGMAYNVVTGIYTVSINFLALPVLGPGQYKIVIQTPFSYSIKPVPGGLVYAGAATWYQVSGFTVPP